MADATDVSLYKRIKIKIKSGAEAFASCSALTLQSNNRALGTSYYLLAEKSKKCERVESLGEPHESSLSYSTLR